VTRRLTPHDARLVDRFRQLHRYVGQLAHCLITQAIAEQRLAHMADPRIPFLTRPGWIPLRPLPPHDVHLHHSAPRTGTLAAARRRLAEN
jgi:hypothetical protein